MAGTIGKSVIPDGFIHSKIYEIRGKKVMIDRDLAELYGVETRMLNQAVKRHVNRFPGDFMFQMTTSEMQHWKSQIVTSNREKMGLRKPPLVFTEQDDKIKIIFKILKFWKNRAPMSQNEM